MKTIKTEKLTIIVEGVIESWLKDSFTFGCLFLFYFLNHKFTDGAFVIDFFISIFLLIMIISKKHKKIKSLSLSETIKYLAELKNEKS